MINEVIACTLGYMTLAPLGCGPNESIASLQLVEAANHTQPRGSLLDFTRTADANDICGAETNISFANCSNEETTRDRFGGLVRHANIYIQTGVVHQTASELPHYSPKL